MSNYRICVKAHTPPVSHSTAAVAALNNTQPVICVRKDVLEGLCLGILVAALNNTQPVICVRKDVLEDL